MTDARTENGLFYFCCPQCGAAGYLPRDYCPACACGQRERRRASGDGMVVAVTTLAQRADSADSAPPAICLVELDEGFKVMAHCAAAVTAGDRVMATDFNCGIPLFMAKVA